MKGIALLAQEYGFRVIEDASHAIGAEYMSRRVGSCQFSDICIFSFHPVKVVTSAEGGMAVTNERSLALKMSVLRSHGITNDPKQMSKPKAGPWSYEQLDFGFNYRQTDLQAALGSSQLSRISDIVARRNQIAQNYDFLLQDLPIVLPAQHPESKSSWHLYIIRLGLAEIDNTHRKIFEHMRNSGIGVALHYIPIHTQPYFAQLGFLPEQYPNAMQHYSEAITLPLFPTLATDDQQFVVSTLKDALAF